MKNKNFLLVGLLVAVLLGAGFLAMNPSSSGDLQGAFPGVKGESTVKNPGAMLGSGSAACDGLVLEINGSSESISDGSMTDLYGAVEDGCEIRVVASSDDQHIAFNCVEIELGVTGVGQDFVDCTGDSYLSGDVLMSKNFEYTVDSDGTTDLSFEDLSYDASGGEASAWSTNRTFSVFAR